MASHFSCPPTGSLKYVSDVFFNVVNVYVGTFAGQAPCGQIASNALQFPSGLYVQPATHDLYVANHHNVLVFHRGQPDPYNTYTDPSGQDPINVTVAGDGTVLASNFTNVSQSEAGSISTWIGGPNGGTFVGNFPETNSEQGATIAAKKNGTVYFTDVDRTMLQGFLWTVSCPAGACGVQTRVAGVVLKFPSGMALDDTGDLLITDQMAVTLDTFELPNPNPSTFALAGRPDSLAISRHDHHVFVLDYASVADEYSYPDGALIGTVSGPHDSVFAGLAVDP
ncbi:MAG TPA: hypothetical protein VJN22_05010 [Candidatus Eremiobacteraceae bacterium]|nr:hypothetical protein [Candidatus Eremiobacteraceae bacterium]